MPRDLTPRQSAGLHSELTTDGTPPKKGKTMRNDRNPKQQNTRPKSQKTTSAEATGTFSPADTAEKPVITGELPIVGVEESVERLQAPLPGVDPKTKTHGKGDLQAERGFMPQHQKPQQPQPRWNLPRR